KKLLGAFRGEAPPCGSTFLPACERSSRIAMRRPHAALGALSQPVASDCVLHDVRRQPAFASEIAPGWRAGARPEAMSPPLYNGREGLGPCRALPRRCSRDEANHVSNTATRFNKTVGAEMFSERKHVAFCRRQGIEPAAAFMNDNDD